MRVDDPSRLFPAGSWQCSRERDPNGNGYAACAKTVADVAYIIFTRKRDGWDVVAKPSCDMHAFWNVYSLGIGPSRGRPNRSSEVKSVIEENYQAAIKGCTSAPLTLKIDQADLDALLDATDWVEPLADANGQKKQ
jgi:hypothetical protein